MFVIYRLLGEGFIWKKKQQTPRLSMPDCKINVCSVLMAIEQWRFISVLHPLWQGKASVFTVNFKDLWLQHMLPSILLWNSTLAILPLLVCRDRCVWMLYQMRHRSGLMNKKVISNTIENFFHFLQRSYFSYLLNIKSCNVIYL